MTMNETTTEPRSGRSTGWFVLLPSGVGAVMAGTLTAAWRSARESCTPDNLDCVGAGILIGVVGIPLAVLLTWAVLAWGVGAWRAATVTFAGAAVAVYSVRLCQTFLTDSPWATALIGGLGFAAVAIATLPGLSRPVRLTLVVLLALICVAGMVRG
jgi:hypothetical protein